MIQIKMGRCREVPSGQVGHTLMGWTHIRVRRNLWAESGHRGVQLLLVNVFGATDNFDDQCII